jgi:hypothetical protein
MDNLDRRKVEYGVEEEGQAEQEKSKERRRKKMLKRTNKQIKSLTNYLNRI